MKKALQVTFYSLIVLILSSCAAQQSPPVWEDTKIGDLFPKRITRDPNDRFIKATTFDTYVIELPAKNIAVLDQIWPQLYTKPIRFNNPGAFASNSFVIRFGQILTWSEIRQILLDAEGQKTEKISTLIPDGQTDYIGIEAFYNEQTIFYTSNANSLEAVTIDPGILTLAVKAEKIPASRGLRKITVKPVFKPLIRLPQPIGLKKSREGTFRSTGFTLNMGPGDFIILGPEKYIEHRKSLGSLFFSLPGKKPMIRIFVIVCSNMID